MQDDAAEIQRCDWLASWTTNKLTSGVLARIYRKSSSAINYTGLGRQWQPRRMYIWLCSLSKSGRLAAYTLNARLRVPEEAERTLLRIMARNRSLPVKHCSHRECMEEEYEYANELVKKNPRQVYTKIHYNLRVKLLNIPTPTQICRILRM